MSIKDKIELHCENYIHIHGNKTNIEDIKSLYIETILDNEDFLQLASKYIRKKGYREAMEYYIEERTPKLDFSSENNEIELNTIKGTVGTIFESDLSVHKALLGCRRFQNIYTTNYDNIIEFTSELLKNEDSKLPYNLVTSGMDLSGNLCHNIIKIHGSISYDNKFQFDGDSHLRYIIAKEDYDYIYGKTRSFFLFNAYCYASGGFLFSWFFWDRS